MMDRGIVTDFASGSCQDRKLSLVLASLPSFAAFLRHLHVNGLKMSSLVFDINVLIVILATFEPNYGN